MSPMTSPGGGAYDADWLAEHDELEEYRSDPQAWRELQAREAADEALSAFGAMVAVVAVCAAVLLPLLAVAALLFALVVP